MKQNIWNAPGRNTSVNAVTTSPVIEAAPNLLVHQTTSVNERNARRSQRKGMCVSCQNIGDIKMFTTAQNAPDTATAARSRVAKWGIW
jgi:hypothetical protein